MDFPGRPILYNWSLLSQTLSAAVDPGFVQSHGAVEGGRSEEAAIVLVRLGWRSRTVLG